MQHETFSSYGRHFCCRVVFCDSFTLVHIQHAHGQDPPALLFSSLAGRLTAEELLSCSCFPGMHLTELKTSLGWLRVNIPAQSNTSVKRVGLVGSMQKPQSAVKMSLLYLVSLTDGWSCFWWFAGDKWNVGMLELFPPSNLDLWGLRAPKITYFSIVYSPGIPPF